MYDWKSIAFSICPARQTDPFISLCSQLSAFAELANPRLARWINSWTGPPLGFIKSKIIECFLMTQFPPGGIYGEQLGAWWGRTADRGDEPIYPPSLRNSSPKNISGTTWGALGVRAGGQSPSGGCLQQLGGQQVSTHGFCSKAWEGLDCEPPSEAEQRTGPQVAARVTWQEGDHGIWPRFSCPLWPRPLPPTPRGFAQPVPLASTPVHLQVLALFPVPGRTFPFSPPLSFHPSSCTSTHRVACSLPHGKPAAPQFDYSLFHHHACSYQAKSRPQRV